MGVATTAMMNTTKGTAITDDDDDTMQEQNFNFSRLWVLCLNVFLLSPSGPAFVSILSIDDAHLLLM